MGVALIVAAIHACNPTLSPRVADGYARTVVAEAASHKFDPMIMVAIVCGESTWRVRAVSADGEDYGLAQLRARFFPACRGDVDPVSAPGERCAAFKTSLLDGRLNLQLAAAHVTESRRFCRRLGRGRGWLAAWQGSHRSGSWCTDNPKTEKVRRLKAQLSRRVRGKGTLRARGGGVARD
jgi:hypothetical protein